MSISFTRRLSRVFGFLFEDKATRNISNTEIFIKVGTTLSLILGHGIYAFLTVEKDTIIVEKKYKMNRNGYTDFMIIDEKGRHFNVNNSLWYWKWDSIEDWHKIEENKQLCVKYYGWRWPVYGLFPNIVTSNKESLNQNIVQSNKFKEYDTIVHIPKLC